MIDVTGIEKGFYKVKEDGEWEVMFFDGSDFYDTTNGQYSSYDHARWIEEIGDKIEFPKI